MSYVEIWVYVYNIYIYILCTYGDIWGYMDTNIYIYYIYIYMVCKSRVTLVDNEINKPSPRIKP